MPSFARSAGVALVTSKLLINTLPRVGALRPEIKLKREVLPAPFGPITPRVSPLATLKVMPSTILAPPIVRLRSSTLIAALLTEPHNL